METNADRQKEVIEGYIAAYNAFDIEAMLALIHPDVVFKNVAGGEVNATATGAEEFWTMAEQTKSLFSSRCQVMTSFDSIGDTASVDIKYEGVLSTDLPNGMNTLRLNGRSVFQFRDGKLLRITDYS